MLSRAESKRLSFKQEAAMMSQAERKPKMKLDKVLAEVDFVRSLESAFTFTVQSMKAGNEYQDHIVSPPRICHLERMPPELRIAIYEYVLSKPRRLNLWARPHILHKGPALLMVSRLVRQEALRVYLESNKFSVQASLAQFLDMGKWLERLAKRCGRQVFRGFRFQVLLHSTWTDFPRLSKLVRLVAAGKVDLDYDAIDMKTGPSQLGFSKSESLFRISRPNTGYYLQIGMEEAILVGVEAREHRWSSARLDREFTALVTRHQSGAKIANRTRESRKRRERAERERNN